MVNDSIRPLTDVPTLAHLTALNANADPTSLLFLTGPDAAVPGFPFPSRALALYHATVNPTVYTTGGVDLEENFVRFERGIRNVSLVNIDRIAKGLKTSLPRLFERV